MLACPVRELVWWGITISSTKKQSLRSYLTLCTIFLNKNFKKLITNPISIPMKDQKIEVANTKIVKSTNWGTSGIKNIYNL